MENFSFSLVLSLEYTHIIHEETTKIKPFFTKKFDSIISSICQKKLDIFCAKYLNNIGGRLFHTQFN